MENTDNKKWSGIEDHLEDARERILARAWPESQTQGSRTEYLRNRLTEIFLLLASRNDSLERVFLEVDALEGERTPYQPGYCSRVWNAFLKASFADGKVLPGYTQQPEVDAVYKSVRTIEWHRDMCNAAAALLSHASLLCTATDAQEIAARKGTLASGIDEWGHAFYNSTTPPEPRTSLSYKKTEEHYAMPLCRQGVEKTTSVLQTTNQVGGTHYKKLAIDPYAYVHANKVEGIEGAVIAYVSRWRDKGGIEDLEKAISSLQRLIELEKANPR